VLKHEGRVPTEDEIVGSTIYVDGVIYDILGVEGIFENKREGTITCHLDVRLVGDTSDMSKELVN